ncbi:MAG: hypothetical protein VX613_02290, partial [Candidatus Thermoplasmatota archaeon]|nr:hypothetical protein [Candidatus Thermoplasmatota archaeon]
MSDAQEIVERTTKRAGVAELISIRSPSDKSLAIIITLFVLMLVLQALQNSIGEIIIIFTMLIISTALLILSADFFVVGAKCIARRFGIAEVIIGLTIVSIGTSLPEIMVTGTAA